MNRISKKIFASIIAVMLIISSAFVFAGCEKPNEPEGDIAKEQYPIVTMEIEGYGTVTIELYPNEARNTVRSFVSLINKGFFDGQKILRVCEGFCIQMGSPTGNPADDCGYTIPGEFAANGHTENTIKHEAGVLSMARSSNPDSASSQFFICTDSDSVKHLDNQYAAFGKVTSGLDIIIAISKVQHNYSYGSAGGGAPVNDIIVTSMTVDTKGITYNQPTKS